MRYASETEKRLLLAAQKARELGHSYVGSEHLLLALADGSDWIGRSLRNAGADYSMLRNMVALLREGLWLVAASPGVYSVGKKVAADLRHRGGTAETSPSRPCAFTTGDPA